MPLANFGSLKMAKAKLSIRGASVRKPTDGSPVYERLVLKLSGESLSGPQD